MVYTVDGQVVSKTGVDVSEHQGEIDWAAVADDGVDFAFVRLGRRGAAEGEVVEDAYFNTNYVEARDAGLDVGVYFFSQSITEEEAVQEAEFVLSRLAGRPLDYPVVYDHEPVEGVEGRSDNLSIEQMTINAKAFCDRIAEAGYPAMIYGNATDLARYSLRDLSSYGIWFAEYGSTIPSRLGRFSIWQYTNQGQVDGISRTVDLNIRFPES
ncbi:MAG: glycoside hydrolase [Eggerthellaceae bacterium]|nr:glycoside hydrolase [Eggerthellaceae bacterium]